MKVVAHMDAYNIICYYSYLVAFMITTQRYIYIYAFLASFSENNTLVMFLFHNSIALPWNQWTSWTSLTCSAVAAQQTRQRMRNRTSCDDCDDDCGACEDDCAVERENRTGMF